MRIPGTKHANQYARWLRSRLVGRAIILGYHRIAGVPWDPFGLCVSPEHFAQQLELLHKHAAPLSAHELVQGLRHQRLPRRAVVVTFDDGYLDTLVYAKPLLEHYQIPATIFVTTGSLGQEYWWDELMRLLAAPAEIPESLSVDIAGKPYTWRLQADSRQQTSGVESTLWRMPTDKLLRLMLPLDHATREVVLAQLRLWSGVRPEAQPISRSMTPSELIDLAASDMIEVGAHTVSHPLLAALPLATQQTEIHQSKETLETLLARPICGFSYPNGSTGRDTIANVRAAGFTYACASQTDIAWYGSNTYCLPRLWVPDAPETTFGRWLKRWL